MIPLLPSLALVALTSAPAPAPAAALSRLEQLVEANILGTHAFQVALARKEGKGDPACYSPGALTDARLASLETHQASLLKADVKAVRAWAEGRASTFEPKADLEPLLASGLTLSDTLPVSVFTRWLADRTKAPRVQVRAVASLFQTNLEVERDGDRLQELFAFYAGLGLPVYLGQLGLPGSDEAFLAMGRELEGKACASPFGTAAADWQIAGRKNWNWGEKNLGIRDDEGAGRRAARRSRTWPPSSPASRRWPAQRIAVDRPLVHDAAPLVDARRVRADRDRDVRSREPGGRVPAVPGRRADLDAGREPLLRRRRGLEAAAGAARGHQPDGRGPRQLPAPRSRAGRGGGEGPHLRRRARPQGHGQRAAGPGARGRARDRHDRDRGEPAAGRRPRPRALPVPRWHPHDGALPSTDGEAVAHVPGGRARGGAPGGEHGHRESSTASWISGGRRRSGPPRRSARRSPAPGRRA